MTRNEVVHLAREAGAPDWWIGASGDGSNLKWLARFAAAVAAGEREACAQVCDHYAVALDGGDNHYLRSAECRQAAEKIRGRGLA